MTCGLSCLAAGATIGLIGDAGVRGFGLTAERGRKWYQDATAASAGRDDDDGGAVANDMISDAVRLVCYFIIPCLG